MISIPLLKHFMFSNIRNKSKILLNKINIHEFEPKISYNNFKWLHNHHNYYITVKKDLNLFKFLTLLFIMSTIHKYQFEIVKYFMFSIIEL
jgi:hypothetical protein